MIRVKYVAILEIVETFDETKNGYLPVDEIRASVTGNDMPQALTDHIGKMFADEADITVTITLADVTEVHNGRFN